MTKHLPNLITLSRIIFAVMLIIATPFSVAFWVVYICAGVSDMLDGFVARRLDAYSELGARLDSIADVVFAVAIAIVVIFYIPIPLWLIICAAGIALLRLIGYFIGYFKFHTFSSLHTYANKAAGALIFAFPLLYTLLGFTVAAVLLCTVAFLSATEELIITIISKELDQDRPTVFIPDRVNNLLDKYRDK